MLQRSLYTDIQTYLVELLMKQDNMSMAASIESRVPFLDHVLVEFAVRFRARCRLAGWPKSASEKGDGGPVAARRSSPAEVGISDAAEWPAPTGRWREGMIRSRGRLKLRSSSSARIFPARGD